MRRILLGNKNGLTWALMLCVSLVCVSGMAADVPAVLSRPDKTSPAAGKVKVYILAGQSNMVGFGYLQGAQPVYPSIYLSADPNIKVGRMTTIGEACRGVMHETLRTTLAWAIDQVTEKLQSKADVMAQLRLT